MIYLFDKNEELTGFIRKDAIISAIQSEELNGPFGFEAEFPAYFYQLPEDHRVDTYTTFVSQFQTAEYDIFETRDYKTNVHDLLEGTEYVGHKDAVDRSVFHMYKVKNVKLVNKHIQLRAIHVALDELKSYSLIRERRPENRQAWFAVEVALEDTRWMLGNTQSTPSRSTSFYHINPLEAIKKVVDEWGVEIGYRLTFDGHKITGRYVDVYTERGGDTGKRFAYGHNALEVVREEDTSELVTAYVGRGKGEEQYDEDGESTDNFTRRINFKDVVWSVASGDPVDKPAGQDYVEIPERTAAYGYSDGKPRIDDLVLEDYEVGQEAELLRATYERLLDDSLPKIHFKATVAKIGAVNIGDSVGIIRKDIDAHYKARVFKVERDLLNDAYTKVDLGDYVDYGASKRRKEIQNKLNQTANTASNLDANALRRGEPIDQSVVSGLQESLRENLFNHQAFTYDLRADNEYGLPAGIWSFDREIGDSPTKVIYVGAGQFAIANSKLPDGTWDFKTFGTGDGFTADLITAGLMRFDRLEGGVATFGGAGNGYGIARWLDEDGELVAELDSEVGGFDYLFIGEVDSPSVMNYNDDDYTLYVQPLSSAANDNNSGLSWSEPFATIQGALNSIPKLNDGQVEIQVFIDGGSGIDINERIVIDAFTGSGTVWIDFRSKNSEIKQEMLIRGCTNFIRLDNVTFNIKNAPRGIYIDRTTLVRLSDMEFYGNDSTTSGVFISSGASANFYDCEFYEFENCLDVAFNSKAALSNCKGLGSEYGMRSRWNSDVSVTGSAPGGELADKTTTVGGEFRGSEVVDYGAATPPTPPETTDRFTTTTGASWRPQSPAWRSDYVYQGIWSSWGVYRGLWLFGDDIRSVVSGRTISRIRVRLRRHTEGGNYQNSTVIIRPHVYGTQPSSQPSYLSPSHSVTMSRGDDRWVTLPSAFHTIFESGQARGLGLYSSSTNQSHYVLMSTRLEVEITHA